SAEREELVRLRRENKQLKLEREILQKPRPGSLGRRIRSRPRVQVREREPGHPPRGHAMPRAGRLLQRVLCVVKAAAVGSRKERCVADRTHWHDPCGIEGHVWCAPHPCRATGQGHTYRTEQEGFPSHDLNEVLTSPPNRGKSRLVGDRRRPMTRLLSAL